MGKINDNDKIKDNDIIDIVDNGNGNDSNSTALVDNNGAFTALMQLPASRTLALKKITEEYLEDLQCKLLDSGEIPNPEEISDDLLGLIQFQFKTRNSAAKVAGDSFWRIPQNLTPAQIADIIRGIYTVKNVNYLGQDSPKSERSYDILSIYQEYGENEGIYVSDTYEIENLIRRFNYDITSKGISEVINILMAQAEHVQRCESTNLVAVNNGIFNLKTKQLNPFDPNLVFTSKCGVDYNPTATVNPVIFNKDDGSRWDIESWIKDLFDDPDVPHTIWQIMGVMLMPFACTGKCIWMISEFGCNGKGSICELIRNLIGKQSCSSLSLNDFSEKFALEDLIGKSAILCDENDVGIQIDKSAVFKAIVTNDPFKMDRKFQKIITFRFRGHVIQCLNGMPISKDKSDSFYRRQLFIKFDKSFTAAERKYIKEDYIHRKEVLEYALHKILHMDCSQIDVPASSVELLEQYKVLNDPIRAFVADILPKAGWRCYPYTLLWEMFQVWCHKNNPSAISGMGRNTFIDNLRRIVDPAVHGWYCTGVNQKQKVSDRMAGGDDMAMEYAQAHKCYPPEIPVGGIFKCDYPTAATPPDNDDDNDNDNGRD